jgi:hypothetical protein
MSLLTCPLCGLEQNPSGPGVSSRRDGSGGLVHTWIPFIEDLRGTPTQLGHPKCFVDEHGLEALISVVSEHDERTRAELSKHW